MGCQLFVVLTSFEFLAATDGTMSPLAWYSCLSLCEKGEMRYSVL
jgi:hypothetical protein